MCPAHSFLLWGQPPRRSHASQFRLATFEKPKKDPALPSRLKTELPVRAFENQDRDLEQRLARVADELRGSYATVVRAVC